MNRDTDTNFEDIIYKDDNVAISLTSLRIGQKHYNFSTISSYRLVTTTPNRKPLITLIAIGAFIVLVAQLNLIPHYLIYNLQFDSYTFSQINLMIGFGILLSIIGLITIVLRPNSYTIQINSGGKDLNFLTSKRKGYIKIIASAVGIGFRYTHKTIQNHNVLPNSLA